MLNNHSHYSLLKRLLEDSSGCEWVLATVVNKEGSSYRAPGAMMLVNSLGQSFGLVSGGCLESDIMLRAKQVLHSGQGQYVEYDMRDEDGYAAELGIGCNGVIGVLLQVLREPHFRLLQKLYQRLVDGQPSYLLQTFAASEVDALNQLGLFGLDGESLVVTREEMADGMAGEIDAISFAPRQVNLEAPDRRSVLTRIDRPFNFWVFGGGADARPLAQMAAQVGWRVTLVDHRTAYARARDFEGAETIIRKLPEDVPQEQQIDGAVLMTHNLALDARWLTWLSALEGVAYIGLLGPKERRRRVQGLAEEVDTSWFDARVNGPAGLDIGGELPESIALSIMAECHAVLHHGSREFLKQRRFIHGDQDA